MKDDLVHKKEYDEQESIHQEILNDELRRPDRKKTLGPLKVILGIFLLLMMLMWFVPHYYVKEDPHPKYIPSIEEVYFSQNGANQGNTTIETGGTISSRDQYRLFIQDRDPQLKGVADRISSLSCDYSENYRVCQSKALFYFVRDELHYVQDPASYEYIKYPLESLENLGGDCDDASVLLSSLLGSIGVTTRLVFVPGHVYVEAYLPDASSKYKPYKNEDWVPLDGTCKTCSFGELSFSTSKAQKQYLNLY